MSSEENGHWALISSLSGLVLVLIINSEALYRRHLLEEYINVWKVEIVTILKCWAPRLEKNWFYWDSLIILIIFSIICRRFFEDANLTHGGFDFSNWISINRFVKFPFVPFKITSKLASLRCLFLGVLKSHYESIS